MNRTLAWTALASLLLVAPLTARGLWPGGLWPVGLGSGGPGVAGAYFVLGVEHILLGFDHLLLVLALMLLVRDGKRLVGAITAFTLAHSLTLTAASLGWVALPARPVEAVIALSLAFAAAELARGLRGKVGLTARAPWSVAFAFGLLHGLGFAGALHEIGLPHEGIALALCSFNLGVEAGQLAFVLLALAAIALLRGACAEAPRWARWVPACAIGGVATFWTFQRLAAIAGPA
jgi:hypothetical protein